MKSIVTVLLILLFLISGIAPAQAQSWSCRNDLEITCNSNNCTQNDTFTPMSISFNDSGTMNVCVYSGCWEGSGVVLKDNNFTIITGHDLLSSTNPGLKKDIILSIDQRDQIGFVKVNPFAHPLICEPG